MYRKLCDSVQVTVSKEQKAIEFNRLTGSSRSRDESRGGQSMWVARAE